jgi:HTH-type transcriptional regulator/antitoxin HigA
MQNTNSNDGMNKVQNLDLRTTANAWSGLAGRVYVPHSEADYRQLSALLDLLTDEVGEDESHPLSSLMEIISILIENYEDEHVPGLSLD